MTPFLWRLKLFFSTNPPDGGKAPSSREIAGTLEDPKLLIWPWLPSTLTPLPWNEVCRSWHEPLLPWLHFKIPRVPTLELQLDSLQIFTVSAPLSDPPSM